MLVESFYNDLVALLGKENVIADQDYIELAEATNYNTTEKIALVVKPGNGNEVRECVMLAGKYKQPIYTISKGKNWGYGSRVPVENGSVLMELDRMTAITDFDEQLGYITVEPGVTFNHVFDFLRERNSSLIISITGGGGDASMIGNALERGIGTGLYADRFSYLCGLEVVLANGDIVATGFEKYGNYKAGKVFRWGEGPYLDGIFSQSNLGIVTKMTIWLMRMPEHLSLVFYKINEIHSLQKVIDVLQDMAIEGLVRPTITLYNDHRVLSSIMQFPFDKTKPGEIDPALLLKQIRQSSPLGNMVGDWNGEISIRSASEEHAQIQTKLIAEKLGGITEDLTVIDVSKKEAIEIFKQHYLSSEKNLAQPTLKSFLVKKYLGIADNSALKQCYWRKRSPIPKDVNPDRDKCGMIWICPIVPFTGSEVLKAISIIETVIKKYCFEPSISLQCTTERCINIIASLSWDREISEEDKAAEKCYFEAVERLEEQGCFSYRTNTLKMHRKQKDTPYNRFVRSLKQALDPQQILSPGRYIDN